ncbi:putative UPF0481 protein At3g02645 [Macadamia integrifolia]|uniref:putative UPF0481 protein At3g02645 n=1 Tax=Macadamia integrifolia TaxID=60698 RepID=UPI001C5305E1|nr:putative UPF0481 protein At3g02645 [Macadamia integrifolia]
MANSLATSSSSDSSINIIEEAGHDDDHQENNDEIKTLMSNIEKEVETRAEQSIFLIFYDVSLSHHLQLQGGNIVKGICRLRIDIEFDVNKGLLTIPTITIFDDTELFLRNLIASEKGEVCIEYFTAYTVFKDWLIDTARDIELLEQKGIIINNRGNREDVVTLFNNIGKQVVAREPYFSGVVKDLEEYHNKTWNKWKASLRHDYFNTTWSSISVGVAVFLIVLTVLQTVFSILSFYYST